MQNLLVLSQDFVDTKCAQGFKGKLHSPLEDRKDVKITFGSESPYNRKSEECDRT